MTRKQKRHEPYVHESQMARWPLGAPAKHFIICSSAWWFGCHEFYFPINIGLIIIPIDELIFFRGMAKNHQLGITSKSSENAWSSGPAIFGNHWTRGLQFGCQHVGQLAKCRIWTPDLRRRAMCVCVLLKPTLFGECPISASFWCIITLNMLFYHAFGLKNTSGQKQKCSIDTPCYCEWLWNPAQVGIAIPTIVPVFLRSPNSCRSRWSCNHPPVRNF